MSPILHVGIEHPNLIWIGVTAILTFVAGAVAGLYYRLKHRQASLDTAPTES